MSKSNWIAKSPGCCQNLNLVDFTMAELPFDLIINWTDRNLWLSVASTVLLPIFWNVVARLEYRTHFLTKLCCGSARIGCYFLAVVITAFGLNRDWRFQVAIESQREWVALDNVVTLYVGYGVIFLGTILVLSSFWRLKITGTFLGDYFGILMDVRITDFPFNVVDHPMYIGTTLNFLGTALIQKSQAGVFLSFVVGITYWVASIFEGRFTAMIYERRENRKLV